MRIRFALFCLLSACRAAAPNVVLDAGPGDVAPGPTIDAGTEDAAPTALDLAGPSDYCNATDPRSIAPDVYPTPEAGEQPYVDSLMAAQSSIHVEIYLLGQGAIQDTLLAKARAGVDVKLIVDTSEQSTNQKYVDALTAAGAQVIWSDPQFTYLHAKYFVVDGKEVMISTGNFSRDYSILLERNFVVRLREPSDVADLVALFDADWARAAPDLSCTRMVVSPINSRQRILDVINGAQATLSIESMQLADTDVRAAVAARKAAGVAVRVMIAQPSWISANADAASYLHSLGIEVRTIPHLHTKAIVADGARAYVGSENLSYTSLDKNREVGLVLTDASSIAPLMDTFEKDWGAGMTL